MIESIRIQNEANYGATPQVLENLSKHNFIFGGNGTGKTTISKIIADESAFPHCPVKWREATKLDTFVYNRDFVAKNFDQPSELKGIFTLGEEDKDALAKIAIAESDLNALVNRIQTLTKTLEGEDGDGGKRSELTNLEAEFEQTCWTLKQTHDDKLQEAFAGLRGSKRAFRDRLLTEAQSNSAQDVPLSELERRAKTVFGKAPEEVVAISVPKYDDLLRLESDPILKKMVIGKSDVDIAAMIQKLGNSDWVKQGRDYYKANDGVCPFCQQDTEDSFAASLDEYFDEAFETDTKAIEQFHGDYESNCERLMQDLDALLIAPSEFLDVAKLKTNQELLASQSRTSLQQIQLKRDEPSQVVELDSLSRVLAAIKDVIEAASWAIKNHNEMVANLAQEKRDLTAQVWKYLLENDIKSALAAYKKKKEGFSKAIDSLTTQIASEEENKRAKEADLRELEKVTTSIQPTIDAVNSLLGKFGFRNFTLAKSESERYYKIVRPDGTDAKETLSEGEKNFLTFLYFYHLLKGSESESGMTNDRVAVFDDPVCWQPAKVGHFC